MVEDAKPLTPSQVAHLFNVSVAAVREWADAGKLPYFRTPGNQRRFRREDVDRILRNEGAA